MDFKETVKTGYNKIAEQYLAQRTANSEDVRLLDDFIELLAPHAKVLDAGCGAGFPISSSLAELFNVIGVDFSEAQIELAKQNIPNATFRCEDRVSPRGRAALRCSARDGPTASRRGPVAPRCRARSGDRTEARRTSSPACQFPLDAQYRRNCLVMPGCREFGRRHRRRLSWYAYVLESL